MDRLAGIETEENRQPFVLSIAGLDPSGGAGLLADIKTFQSQGVYGLGVMTASTMQTDKACFQVGWQPEKTVLETVQRLSERFVISAVKLGVLRSRLMLEKILAQIQATLPDAKIIWDPVFKATAGADFFQLEPADLSGDHAAGWIGILKACTVITPNAVEANILSRLLGLNSAGGFGQEITRLDPLMRQIGRYTAVLLKGGHLENGPDTDGCDQESPAIYDRLYYRADPSDELRVVSVRGNRSARQGPAGDFEKHGSGCVHSSLVTALLARQLALPEAAAAAKTYMEEFLFRTRGRLGVHTG